MLIPKQEVPNVKVPLINGTQWELNAQHSDNFTMIVFYRGLHCPVCKKYLEELTDKLDEFKELGVHLVAISHDSEERAKETAERWKISELPLGYGFPLEEARKWGLYISSAISDKEPEAFFEPGLFLIKPDGALYAASVQSMPFARPGWEDLIKALKYILKNDYPARGVMDDYQLAVSS